MFDSIRGPRAGRAGTTPAPTIGRRVELNTQLVLLKLPEPLLTVDALEPTAEQNHGEIFTRPWVVELILDLVGYTPDRDLAGLAALEPACGTGAFLVPMVKRLSESVRLHGRKMSDARSSLRAHDLLAPNVAAARAAVVRTLVSDGWARPTVTKLAERWITQADFLLHDQTAHSADVVVGNPPYVRLEKIPEARSNGYRAACLTMGGGPTSSWASTRSVSERFATAADWVSSAPTVGCAMPTART